MAARKLILLRHGDIGKEYRGRYIGKIDVPLSDRGRRQAEELAERLRREAPRRCLTSPLRRCRETADIISKAAGLTFETDPDLREIDFGDWDGMTFDEILKTAPDEVKRWDALESIFAFPNGESLNDFLARVKHVAGRIIDTPEETVIVCTHGGVIRTLICRFLGLPVRNYILFDVKPGSLATIDLFDGKGVLTGLNKTGGGPD